MRIDGPQSETPGTIKISIGRGFDVAADVPYIQTENTQTYQDASDVKETNIEVNALNITLGENTSGNYVASVSGGTGISISGSGGEAATPQVILTANLDQLLDVTAPTPASGDFLKWNGTAWVNDPIDLGTDTSGNYVSDVTAGTGIAVSHTPAEGSTPTVSLNATLNDLSNVTAPSPASGDFLKWNGSAWVNDPINLGTDTTGNYMSGVTAGAGITVTHTPSEGSSATVALNASLNTLTDVVVSSAAIGDVIEHNGTNFVNRPLRAPAQRMIMRRNDNRYYGQVGQQVIDLNTISVGSCTMINLLEDGNISHLAIRLSATYGGATSYNYRLALYADDDGEPGSLIEDAGQLTIATGDTQGFKELALNGTTGRDVNAGDRVWLACAATHGPGAGLPSITHVAGYVQPYADYGLTSAAHNQASCFGYLTGPGTAFPATWSMSSPETQPVGVMVFAKLRA
jgi:hypothetical protein